MSKIIPLNWARRPKYGNKPIEIDGIKFASQGEAERWGELKLFERAGGIKNLKRQCRHDLIVNNTTVGTYRSDFEYLELCGSGNSKYWQYIIEDFKGAETELFKLKWAIMKAMFPNAKFIITRARRR